MIIKVAVQGNTDKESVQNIIALAYKIATSLEGQYTNKIVTFDNATAIIKVSGSSAIVIITLPTSGFAVHPRTSTYPNGVDFINQSTDGSYKELTTTALFPLYDNDNGTMLISGETNEWDSVVADPDNYGIHAWTSEDRVITWRGWPCRTVGCGRETSIEGVTLLDVQTAYNTYYTPLFAYLYVDGEALPVPGKVRGAGYSSAGAVFISTVNYTQYDFVGMGSNEVNPDGLDWLYDNPGSVIDDSNKAGKVGNYYDELYVQAQVGVPYTVNGRVSYATSGATNQEGQSVDGWLRIGHRISPITNLSVWFSADGKSAVEDGGTWSWTVNGTTFTSSFAARTDSAKHEYTVYGTPNPWKVLANTSWQAMYMLTKAGLVRHSRDDKTVNSFATHADNDETSTVPVYSQSRPDPTGQYITWAATTTPNVYYATLANLKSLPVTWTGATSVDQNGGAYVDTSDKCGIFTISAVDNCGLGASRECRGALGRWVGGEQVRLIIPDWGTCVVNDLGGTEYKCNIQDPCSGYFSGYWDDINALQAAAEASGATSFRYNKYSSVDVGPNTCDPTCYTRVGMVVCYQVISWEC